MKIDRIAHLILIAFIFLSESHINAQQKTFKHKIIVKDITIPWGLTFLPDNSMLYTEKKGKMTIFRNGKKREVFGLPRVVEYGQGGLMDVELHPNFKENHLIYFTYASGSGQGEGTNTALMRAELRDGRLMNKKVLYKAGPNSRRGQHFGSRIAFDREGYIYFTIGDRGSRDLNPQDISRDCGKVYRLKDDGTIPVDNPFVNNSSAKKAIFSYGHRNPQGMEINPFTGEIWTHEHGPRGGDEINIIQKGKNYGWPKASYGINYSGTKFTNKTTIPGMEDPLHFWTPSIAPSGMAFVTSKKYPNLYGKLLVGSLKFQYVSVCTLKNGKVVKEEKILKNLGRVRSVEEGPDGFIYVGIEYYGIVKLLP